MASNKRELDEETVTRLRWAILRLGRGLRTASRNEGLTPAQTSALALLVREGPMRPGDMAEAEGVNPTMLSRILGHLAEAGLVEREPDPHDGRAARVRATAAGRRRIARLRAPGHAPGAAAAPVISLPNGKQQA